MIKELNLFHGDVNTTPCAETLEVDWNFFDCYIAENKEGQIVGFLAGYPFYQFHSATTRYEIQALYVQKNYRGQEIAQNLMRHAIIDWSDRGVQKFSLKVGPKNEKAKNLYHYLGFQTKKETKDSMSLDGLTLERFLEKTGF